ncbi:MAG: SDR family NAD(P)-dependent oxidoreductase [Thermodesulfovibrionales bacterium]
MIFKDKVVLVTGSTRGIGKGIALAFAHEGAIVGINGTKNDLCDAVVKEIGNTGGMGVSLPGDISDTKAVKLIFEKLLGDYGKLDILINNAGIIYVEELINTTDEQWDHTMAVNCRGVFLCSREAARHMIKGRSGKIINISSQLGKTGAAKYTHYCASKFAVIGFTQALAKELAPYGINVNAVCPGIVYTDMTEGELVVLQKVTGKSKKELMDDFLKMIPLGRYETPQDIANLVLFLSSDKADYMTGQSINITGGVVMH